MDAVGKVLRDQDFASANQARTAHQTLQLKHNLSNDKGIVELQGCSIVIMYMFQVAVGLQKSILYNLQGILYRFNLPKLDKCTIARLSI